jgi:HSP20 family protein
MREALSLRDEMDRVLDAFYGRMTPSGERAEGDWYPPMDIAETPEEVTACLEVPGLKKEDIKVSVHDGILTVTGEKRQETSADGENFHKVERSYGYFKRSVALPSSVDSDKVKAAYKDGVLKVTLPKLESKKPKEIQVSVA